MKTKGLLCVVCLFLGCRANLQAQGSANLNGDASGDASGDVEQSADVEGSGAGDGSQAALVGEGEAGGSLSASEPALLGARHDLRLVTERATNKCQCLAVALGAADLAAFRWKAGTPQVDAQTQLVIALSSENEKCEEPKGSLGASYWGYRIKGNDVFVFVETSGGGRPLTGGAIIPKPFAGGQVYVAPASKRTPYGRGEGDARECKLGNPGVQRTTPLQPGEQGAAEVTGASSEQ